MRPRKSQKSNGSRSGKATRSSGVPVSIGASKRPLPGGADSGARFRLTFDQVAVGIAHTSIDGRILEVNRRLCEMLGYSSAELLAMTMHDLMHPDDRDRQDDMRQALLAGASEPYSGDKRFLRKGGSVYWVNQTATLARGAPGSEPYVIQTIDVINKRKLAEFQLARANRARRVMAECNQILVHTTDETKMLEDMCRIVVESGGYKMAWVGLSTSDEMRPVHVAAHAGFGDDAPMTGSDAWDADGRYQGFMHSAITAGEPHIARDILNQPKHAQRRKRAIKHSFQSSIALPLKSDGSILGAIAMYAREPDAFDADEIALLTELSDDIAFGIASLRARAAREQAEARSREIERRLRETFEQAAVGISHVDLDGFVMDANQKFCEMLGYSKEALLGKHIRDITHPDDYGMGAQFRSQLETGTVRAAAGEKRFVRGDGGIMWARRTMSTACDDAGRARYVISIIEDITERKEAIERYQTTFDNAPVGIMHTSVDGDRILHANAKLCTMLGYEHEALLGMKTDDFLHPDHANVDRPKYRERMLAGEIGSFSSERLYRRKDGSDFWANRTVSLVRDTAGKPLYFLRIVEDIGERKQAEGMAASERALLRNIIDTVPDYIYVKDAEGRFRLANRAWLNERNLGAEAISGKTVFDIFPPELAGRMESQDQSVMKTGVPILDVVERVVLRATKDDGPSRPRWFSITKVPMNDASGRVIGTIGTSRDITERVISQRHSEMEHRITQVLADSDTIAEAMFLLIRTLCSEMGWNYGARWALADGGIRRTDNWSNIEMEHDPTDRMLWFQQGEGGSQALLRKAWRYKEPTWIADINQHESFGRRASALKFGLRSALAFPVVAGGEVIGVMEFFGREVRQPDERLLRITGSLGRQIGQFIQRKEAEQALRTSEERYRDLFDLSPLPMWVFDDETLEFLAVNEAALNHYGYSREAFLRMNVRTIWAGNEQTAYEESLRDRAREQTLYLQRKHRTRDGRIIEVEVTARQVVQGGRRVRLTLINDVTERKQSERRREMEHAVTRVLSEPFLLQETMPAIIRTICEGLGWACGAYWTWDKEAEVLQCANTWHDGTDGIAEFIAVSSASVNEAPAWRGNAPGEKSGGVVRKVWFGGSPVWFQDVMLHADFRRGPSAAKAGLHSAFGFPILAGAQPLGVMEFYSQDIKQPDDALLQVVQSIGSQIGQIIQRKLAEEQLSRLAHYDLLTGLPNRALYLDRVKQAIVRAQRQGEQVAVLFLDLDRFKLTNDTFGHSSGDRLLKQVGERLATCVRASDTVGRFGGDEFGLVLADLRSTEDARLVAQKILNVFETPFEIEGRELFITASVGISLYPVDGNDDAELMKNADIAMYRAKEFGRNDYQFFSTEMNTSALKRFDLENSMRHALERGEFLLHYQPKASLSTGEITGFEALLRWKRGDHEIVAPADFVPLLEETGLIVPVGEWVIEEVCRELVAWRNAGARPVPIALNLSPRQFRDRNLGETVERILRAHGVGPHLIELEITESSLMENTEQAIRTLAHLKSLGLRLSIDDFGTGYSSLSYLKRFPISALKIDRSFVDEIATNADDATITLAVIGMSHNLGLKVIAEGVETWDQLDFLTRNGCSEMQGYYFSQPLLGADCLQWLLENRRLLQSSIGVSVA